MGLARCRTTTAWCRCRRAGGRRDLASIRILAHGRPGALLLGAGELTRETLAPTPRTGGDRPGAGRRDGDVQIYGCEVGKGRRSRLRAGAGGSPRRAGRRRSAPVGHADLGGDWRLDVGELRTPPLHLREWLGLLGLTDHAAAAFRSRAAVPGSGATSSTPLPRCAPMARW
jgi:hypothetical protein